METGRVVYRYFSELITDSIFSLVKFLSQWKKVQLFHFLLISIFWLLRLNTKKGDWWGVLCALISMIQSNLSKLNPFLSVEFGWFRCSVHLSLKYIWTYTIKLQKVSGLDRFLVQPCSQYTSKSVWFSQMFSSSKYTVHLECHNETLNGVWFKQVFS